MKIKIKSLVIGLDEGSYLVFPEVLVYKAFPE